MSLTPQQLHALAVAAKPASKVRDDLKEGHNYRIDFAVRVKGTLSVGATQPTSSATKLDPLLLLAAVLDRLGPRKCKTVVTELLATLAGKKLVVSEEATKQATRLVDSTTVTSSGTKRGNVTGEIEVTPFEEH